MSFAKSAHAASFMVILALATVVTACGKQSTGTHAANGPGVVINDMPTAPSADQCLLTYGKTDPRFSKAWDPFRRQQIRPYGWTVAFYDGSNQPPNGNGGAWVDTTGDDSEVMPGDMWGDWPEGATSISSHGHNHGRHGHKPTPTGPTFQTFPEQGLCGCRSFPGTVPACGPQGLSCVPLQNQSTYTIATWGYTSGTFGFSGYSSVRSLRISSSGACPTSVAQICDRPGQVVGRAYCRPTSANSPYGIWVDQRGQQRSQR